MIFIALFFLILAAIVSLGECYYERDWPRETIQYFLAFGVMTAIIASL